MNNLKTLIFSIRDCDPNRDPRFCYRRLLKCFEEVSEIVSAYLAVTSNSYKNLSWADVREEIIDSFIMVVDSLWVGVDSFPEDVIDQFEQRMSYLDYDFVERENAVTGVSDVIYDILDILNTIRKVAKFRIASDNPFNDIRELFISAGLKLATIALVEYSPDGDFVYRPYDDACAEFEFVLNNKLDKWVEVVLNNNID